MPKLSALYQDLQLERDGAWFEHHSGARFKVARSNSSAYEEARRLALEPYIERARRQRISEEELREILTPAFAAHLLRGWEQVDDDAGQPLPCTPENAERVLRDERLRDLREWLFDCSDRAAAYRARAAEDARGN